MSKENFFQIILSKNAQRFKSPNYDNIIQHFPEINYKLHTFRSIKKEFYKIDDPRIPRAFDKVGAYAFKADIFRYYLLYKYGGWYSDINNYFTGNQIKTENLEFYAFKDIPEHSSETSFQNSILYSKPNNKMLKDVLYHAVENVENSFYGNIPLDVSGPSLLGSHIHKNFTDIESFGKFAIHGDEQRAFFVNEKIFALYKPFGFIPGESGISGGNKYNDLWHSRILYGEQ
jgi:mannosyltransferase OCH1-like enzyme